MNIETFTLCEKSEIINNELVITKPLKFLATPKVPLIVTCDLAIKVSFSDSEILKPQKLIYTIFAPDGKPYHNQILKENMRVPKNFLYSANITFSVNQFGSHLVLALIGTGKSEYKIVVLPIPADSGTPKDAIYAG